MRAIISLLSKNKAYQSNKDCVMNKSTDTLKRTNQMKES